jgi:hypothetical protein
VLAELHKKREQPQNQAGYGLSVAPQNRWENEDGAGHMSISNGLLSMKASQVRFSQYALKLVETRRRVVHMAPSKKSRGDQVEDGRVYAMSCIGLCYSYFIVFIILDIKDILVF